MHDELPRAGENLTEGKRVFGFTVTAGANQVRSVLGSWVGVRRLSHISLFLPASRMVLPKILVLTMVMAAGGGGAGPIDR